MALFDPPFFTDPQGRRRRWSRWDAGGPQPVIRDRRLRWLRKIDEYTRCVLIGLLHGQTYWVPSYCRARMTEEQRSEEREAIRDFLGGRSPNPQVVRFYRERSRLALLADPGVNEEYKQKLRDAGPSCSPEDIRERLTAREINPGDRLIQESIAGMSTTNE